MDILLIQEWLLTRHFILSKHYLYFLLDQKVPKNHDYKEPKNLLSYTNSLREVNEIYSLNIYILLFSSLSSWLSILVSFI